MTERTSHAVAPTRSPGLPAKASLTTKTVERIFAKLAAIYGSRFADLWQGVNVAEAKATWSEYLGRFSVDTIALALDDCATKYEYPPNLPQFFALCKSHHKEPAPPLLLADKRPRAPIDPRVKAEIDKLLRPKKPKRPKGMSRDEQLAATERLIREGGK